MPRAVPLINNFNTGEVSELIDARSDLSKYSAACKTLQNAIPLVEGGAKKVPGTYFAGIAANGGPLGTASTGKSRLVSFQFSTGQNAVLEFFQYGVRFWIDNGLVLAVGGLSDWTPATTYANNAQVELGWYVMLPTGASAPTLVVQAPYAEGAAQGINVIIGVNTSDTLLVREVGTHGLPLSPQSLQILLADTTSSNNSGAAIQTAIQALGSIKVSPLVNVDLTAWQAYWLNNATPPVTSASLTLPLNSGQELFRSTIPSNTDNFPVDSPYWQQFPATEPLVVTTPYTEADLFTLDVSTQSADVLYIAHVNYPPATLNRYTDSNWTYTPISGTTVNIDPPAGQLYGTAAAIQNGYGGLSSPIINITLADPAAVSITVPGFQAPFLDGALVYINECSGLVQLNQGKFLVANLSRSGFTWTFNLQDPSSGNLIDTSAYPTSMAYTGGGFVVATPSIFCGPGNYPACAALYQQRLCFAGSLNSPTQMSGSVQGDYSDFICDPNEDNYAIQFTLVSQQVNPLRWMIGSPNALLLGTSGGVFSMFTTDGQALSQTDVTAAIQSTIGTGSVAPQLVNSDVIWITKSGTIVRLFLYNWVTNQWEGPDLTRLNREITLGPTLETSGLIQTAFQSQPYPIFWAVRADGQLVGLTYERQDQVFAWFRKNGPFTIESVACVSQDEAEDQVWIAVSMTVAGVLQRYIMYFMPQEIYGELSNAFFVDAGLQWNGGPSAAITGITQANPCVVTAPNHGFSGSDSVSISGVEGMVAPNGQTINSSPISAYSVTIINSNTFSLNGMDTTLYTPYISGGEAEQVANQVTGLQYLQGQNAVAVGDGAQIWTGVIPSNGTVNFPYYANLVTIGLPINTIVEPMNPVVGDQSNTSRGKRQKISRVTLSLYQSMGGEYGTDLGHLYPIPYGEGSLGNQPALFTGEITRDLDGEWEDWDTIAIVHNDPFPFTLRAVIPRLDVAVAG